MTFSKKKRVRVKIKSCQRSLETDEKVCVGFECEGTLEACGDGVRLIYTEPTSGDVTGCAVELFALGSQVKMKKSGAVRCEIDFSGRLWHGDYVTTMGAFALDISDCTVKGALTANGGSLIFDYVSRLEGLDGERIKMRIDVLSEGGSCNER